LDTLDDSGVTTLDSLIAATAAQRLGLRPRLVHLDRTSFHVDGRYNSAEEPDAGVIHITRGYSRDHCCSCPDNGRSCSISPTRRHTFSDCSGNPMRYFILKKGKSGTECRVYAWPHANKWMSPLGKDNYHDHAHMIQTT
jgi:hypothetical protein